MKKSFTKADTMWPLLILCAAVTVFFFKLLWHAPDINTAFTVGYLCSVSNLSQLVFYLGFPLSIYLSIRLLSKR